MAKARDYGAIADGSTNCARAINLCLQETGVVEFDEGTYIIGGIGISNPLDASIYWGFPANYTRGIKLIGKGKGKTILKFAASTGTHSVLPYGSAIFLVNTYSYIGDDNTFDAGDCVISGITFDGNYDENFDPVNPFFKTVSGVRLVGTNNLIEDCEFKGFGIGVANQEAFALQSYLPSTAADGAKGVTVRNCSFNTPGANSRPLPPGSTAEAVTWVAFGGNGITGKYATGCVVEGCSFTNITFGANQRSPQHGITPAATRGCIIRNNSFTAFAGQHIYVDSYKNFELRIEKNSATLCPQFISFVTQNWVRLTGNVAFAPLISSHVNVTIQENTVGLAGPNSFYYDYNLPPYNATFFLYQYDRDVTPTYNPGLIPGFKNINIQGNSISNSAGNDIVFNNGGYWPPAGAFQNGEPFGPVPNITDVRVIQLPTPPTGPRAWDFKPVTLEPAKSAKPVVLNRLVYKSLTVAGFTQNLEAWAGASRIFALQDIIIPNQNFSIRLGQNINVPTYVMTVKWVAQGVVRRYKLWSNGYEVLSYPLYNGEIIPGEGAQFEYWTTSFATRAFSEAFDLETDILEKPDSCCDEIGTALANGICQIGTLPNPYPTVYPVENFYVCAAD
jgi:hypothetical protein